MTDFTAIPPEAQKAWQALEAKNLGLQAEVLRLQAILKLREEEVRLLNCRIWGPKSEKLSDKQIALLGEEIVVLEPEVEKEAELPDKQKEVTLPKAKKPRQNHPGREALPAHLERREEIIPCCPADCACAKCGQPRPIIG